MTLNDVPLASQSLGITQPLIRGNFQTIDAAFAVDHVPYTLSGQGKHNKVTFPVQGSAPSFSAGEEGLYNAAYAASTQNELFVHKQDFGATTRDVPMTASILGTTNVGNTITNNVWSFLPSGLAILSGFTTLTGSDVVNIGGCPIVTGTTRIISVMVSPYNNGAADYVVNLVGVVDSTKFRVFVAQKTSTAAATGQFSWIAIISPT